MSSERNVTSLELSSDVVRVLQLTDTHLCPEHGGTLLGMDTDHSLQAVIDLAKRERDGVDVVLGTGDLSDSGAAGAYQRLCDYFNQFDCASYWLPGNHDYRERMDAAAQDGQLASELRAGNWQILLLDSQIPGEVGGELGRAELDRLAQALQHAKEQGLHTLVCLHHHPVEIGCRWLDEQIVADAGEFFAVLGRYDSVRAVLWGHVHQEIDRLHGDVRLLASPSTCVQFAAGSDNFRADDQPPGYRWLDLHPDGRVETGVSRVRDVKFNVDLDSGGYL